MAFHGKTYRQAASKVDRETLYTIEGALRFLKDNPTTKFDATAEIAFRLGVDPTKSDQAVRGTVTLPHGTGKTVRVLVFASGPAADAAREAGAEYVGFEELLEKVKGGFTEFDVAVATPDAMKEVRKLGKVLGPRGLMPNPKTGTVSEDTAAAVEACKAGRVEFRMDRHGNVMVPFGKMSFESEALRDNCRSVVNALNAARPTAAKGLFIKRATITSSMGPGLRLDPREIA
ncbi:MAG: 50S ribosomal protein L1 [Kiritimatiellia bacterium]|jgi:large subunit ribosomal protein L1|nr:50S ribosomal protein L1 [Kiritimatiellia bacterium]